MELRSDDCVVGVYARTNAFAEPALLGPGGGADQLCVVLHLVLVFLVNHRDEVAEDGRIGRGADDHYSQRDDLLYISQRHHVSIAYASHSKSRPKGSISILNVVILSYTVIIVIPRILLAKFDLDALDDDPEHRREVCKAEQNHDQLEELENVQLVRLVH